MNAFERLRNGGRKPEEQGFTLIELLVTMLITGIVLTMLGAFFANISRLTSWSGKDRDATGQAALALDAVRSVVRVATDNPSSATTTDTAVQAGSGSSLSIIAYSNTSVTTAVPVLVTFVLDSSGTFTEKRQLGVLNAAGYYRFTGTITNQTIASGFSTTTATTPFFTYIDKSGKQLTATNGLSATDRGNVTFVRVTTTLDPVTAGAPDGDVVVTTSIGMPNLARDVSATVSVPNLPTPTETPTPTPTPSKSTASASASPTPTTGASSTSAGSGTGSGSGSGSGTGSGTTSPTGGTGGSGGGSSGGGSGTSTPAPSATATATSTPKPSVTPTATPKPTATAKPPVVIDQ